MSSQYNPRLPNPTTTTASPSEVGYADATWILLCGILIFTMQTGFGLLESGVVSKKNTTNILMKNVVDVILGGLSYWAFGYAISFGEDRPSTSWLGFGDYGAEAAKEKMGPAFVSFFFQLSFATTATTIASGSMAERCDFKGYCVFSFFNTVVYAVPARWLWSPHGFLNKLGVSDIAGSGGIHLLGGISAFVAAWMLGPRKGRYDKGIAPLQIKNPQNAIIGLFFLWFGWVAFNSGSTFGVTGESWKFAARATATTMVGSFGGGFIGIIYMFYRNRFEVMDIINPILGGLVSVASPSSVVHTTDAFAIGLIGGIIVFCTSSLADRMRVDDPIGAFSVHGICGIWGLLAVGLFAESDGGVFGTDGVFRGGGWRLLGVQVLAACCIILYSSISTFIILWLIDKLFYKLRMEEYEEVLGADYCEHFISPRDNELDYPPELFYDGSREEIIEIAKKIYSSSSRPTSAEELTEWETLKEEWLKSKNLKILPRAVNLKARRIKKRIKEVPTSFIGRLQRASRIRQFRNKVNKLWDNKNGVISSENANSELFSVVVNKRDGNTDT